MAESPASFGTPQDQGTRRLVFLFLTRFWIFFFLLALMLYFSLATPNHAFFQASNFKNIALDTSEVILLAIGETFVIVTAGIDLSVGGILVFSGVAGGLVMLNLSGTHAQTLAGVYPHDLRGIFVGGLVTRVAGAGWGFSDGALVSRLQLPRFIVTLGTVGLPF